MMTEECLRLVIAAPSLREAVLAADTLEPRFPRARRGRSRRKANSRRVVNPDDGKSRKQGDGRSSPRDRFACHGAVPAAPPREGPGAACEEAGHPL